MIPRLLEMIVETQKLLHAVKPLLFELALLVWAVYEMGRFVAEQVGLTP
jgi:hypothetical protein